MRTAILSLCLLFGSAATADGQVRVSIGINLTSYPELVPVPGYPVYYDANMNSNYFFYDGMYWVYQGDAWYASSWYNGPWDLVDPDSVPAYLLMVPVSYYRQPPAFFLGWQSNAAPRWGEHWGRDWEQRHSGWDRADRNVPRAPLPLYQRQYAGDRYPRADQQRQLQSQNDHYVPHDPQVRNQLSRQHAQGEPAAAQRGPAPGAAFQASHPQDSRPQGDRGTVPSPMAGPGAAAAARQPAGQARIQQDAARPQGSEQRGQVAGLRTPDQQDRGRTAPGPTGPAAKPQQGQPQRAPNPGQQPPHPAPQAQSPQAAPHSQGRPAPEAAKQEPSREQGRDKPEERGQDRR